MIQSINLELFLNILKQVVAISVKKFSLAALHMCENIKPTQPNLVGCREYFQVAIISFRGVYDLLIEIRFYMYVSTPDFLTTKNEKSIMNRYRNFSF